MQAGVIVLAHLLPALGGTAPLDSVSQPPAVVAVSATMGLEAINWMRLRDSLGPGQDTARTRRRIQTIEYSGFYHFRLKLHRILSFTMIPIFVGTYVTGEQVLKHGSEAPDWALNWHRPLATATAVLFSANTVTGLWNLWDSRKDPAGRTKRYVHSLLFLAADAGFAYTGLVLAKEARESGTKRNAHRTVALVSMGLSVSSWGLMLFFK